MTFPIVVDGRNVLDLDTMRRSGFWYHSTGRTAVAPDADLALAEDFLGDIGRPASR
jgi:hypothetical protein